MRFGYIFFLIGAVWSPFASASYIACSDINVKLETAVGPAFHDFSDTGVTGSTMFLSVPVEKCWNSTGETLASNLYMVVDEMESPTGLKKIWASMLLSAEARNKTINFHASDKGTTSSGRQVLEPYFLTVNP